MKYTISEAAKQIKLLNYEKDNLLQKEAMNSTFVAATTENLEELRPEYSYDDTRRVVEDIDQKIRKLRNAINVFNISTNVEEFAMTLDQLLIYIPQLSAKKEVLQGLMSRQEKVRDNLFNRAGNIIDYRYTNYDPKEAEKDYFSVVEELSKSQTAVDLINNTATIEVDI